LTSPAFLRDANGVCFLDAATRRFIIDDVVCSWCSDACRPARSSDFWVTTEDCAQAASDAAPSVTASSRMNFPARAAGINGASTRVQPALTSTHEIPVQPMEDMLQSPLAPQPKPKTNTRQWRDRIRAETWPDVARHGFHSAIPFECGDWVTESSLKKSRRPTPCRRCRSAPRVWALASARWSRAGRAHAHSPPLIPSPRSSVRPQGPGRARRY
jgi:hypothetical protein